MSSNADEPTRCASITSRSRDPDGTRARDRPERQRAGGRARRAARTGRPGEDDACFAPSPPSGRSAAGASRCRRRARTLFLPHQAVSADRHACARRFPIPSPAGTFSDEAIAEALRLLDLGHLAGRLDESEPWDQQLSVDEQQRLTFARAFLHKPDWLIMDDATGALDEAMEQRVYETLAQRLPQHRRAVDHQPPDRGAVPPAALVDRRRRRRHRRAADGVRAESLGIRWTAPPAGAGWRGECKPEPANACRQNFARATPRLPLDGYPGMASSMTAGDLVLWGGGSGRPPHWRANAADGSSAQLSVEPAPTAPRCASISRLPATAPG